MTGARAPLAVLLIEDDDDTRETMQLVLEFEGFRVRTAPNGREGLRVLDEEGSACIILLDWMMPVMNGREFLEAIGEHHHYSDIPVLVLTAFSGKDHGIPTSHLKKPVSLDVLVSELHTRCEAG